MSNLYVEVISGSAIFNLTLIAVLSWFKSVNKPGNFWLGWMFFATSAAILDNIFIFAGHGSILLYHIGLTTNLAWGGYLIAFTQSLRKPCIKTLHFNWKLFIPVYLYLPFFILTLFDPSWSDKTITLARTGQMTPFSAFYNLSICLYTIGANAVLLIQEYRNPKREISTAQSNKIKEILWIMFVLQMLAFVPFMFKFDVRYIILYMPVFGQIFFLYVFFRITVSSQLLFDTGSTTDLTVKYATINLNEQKTEEIKTQIIELMDKEKPYLKLDYTLTDMAKDLKVLPNQLSMVINSRLNCSFPEYVNSLRIKTAVELLNKASKNNLTIEAIAYESGFNNRTSFYKAFKKETGKLPSEYLKKVSENVKEVV